MCRLLGYVADSETDFPSIVGEHFDEFVALSKIHCDGWGITSKDESGVVKEPTPAVESPDFMQVLKSNKSNASLLHFRWATEGINVERENNHPFHYGKYSFIHNGSIKPADALDPFIEEKYRKEFKGSTDSERYFFLLVQKIEELGLVPGIKAAVALIKEHATYSAINAMVLTPDKYVIINEHDVNKIPSIGGPDYYELRYIETEHAVMVGSSGWNQEGWHLIPNHSIMIVDRHDRSFETAKL